ncbi:alpha-ketoacid dehydrogenase subunit beta [Dactylosporangium sp. AC04546]|uniref:alpha-ketoacid dehydrogenase subunit beta n=1 Tax=Dactylosporangium sp. AC04546 TaxID=2862460 RepID=UPI001EE13626|nr:alpha-ketoacid dehydrogenase subunit beta [Dactylosporangium sp. AC04546]WVK88997.1 alpha-ketoacid dehydrogenase subunit beta [Dactylosporangium sp. AC04546]
MSTVTMAQALNQALHDAMAEDDRVLVFGEDVGTLGGVFRITDRLAERFGDRRCFDAPLAESGIVGTALGLALYGYRPVVEMQFDGFSYPAAEQVISHVAKYRNRSRGRLRLPLTIRIPFGGGIGGAEHHGESPETYYAHTAGLTVVAPATAADAYGLLRAAIELDDPVVFLEPKRRYWSKEDVELPAPIPPIGAAVVRREGTDCTVVAYGPAVRVALDAAEAAAEDGHSIEVLDLRSLVPLDEDTLLGSVRKTGRCVVVHEAPSTLGFGAEVAAIVGQHAFHELRAPVLRVTGFDVPYPPAKIERYYLPDVDRVLDAVDQAIRQ